MTGRYDKRGRSTRTPESQSGDWFAGLTGRVTPQGTCLVLDGDPDSYGVYKGQKAHRAIYQAVNGPIPEGWDVHHTCEVKGCINPRHLFAVGAPDHGQIHGARRRWGGPSM